MAKKSNKQVEEFEYRAEMQQLMNLIVHSLYTHKEIFLRELISNASDALNKIRIRMLTDRDVLDPDADLAIRIEINPKTRRFTIEDTGIGMTKEELVEEIGTVAHSGTLEFLRQMQKESKPIDANLIGQFGVGFYSVFMVTDEVTIETRHADKDSKGYRWVSSGGKFTIEEIDRKQRGTKITFLLRDEDREFAEEYRVKEIIQKYSNFVDFPIYLGKEQVNRITALWQEPKNKISEEQLNEFYKFITNDFQPPLAHLHLSVEGAVNFKGLIFIPKSAPPFFFQEERHKTLQLYSNKVFIQDDAKDILPEYLRFVKGVIDTEDLPLNVSREWTQSSPTITKIRNVLVSKILGFLEDLAKNQPEKYKTFYNNFGSLFKTGVNADFTNKDKIVNLLRFQTTRTEDGELISLKTYIERMKPDQKEIYYLSGDNLETLKRNPSLEYFRKHDYEVLLLSDPVDVFIVPSIGEFENKKLVAIDKADLDLEEERTDGERLSDDLARSLISVFKETLGDKVEDVIESRRLVDSPVTLVSGKQAMDKQVEKMMKLMDREFTASKKILEVNMAHPLIKNLSRLNMLSSSQPLLRQCILQLYEGAQLVDGTLESPTEFVQRMSEIMLEATK